MLDRRHNALVRKLLVLPICVLVWVFVLTRSPASASIAYSQDSTPWPLGQDAPPAPPPLAYPLTQQEIISQVAIELQSAAELQELHALGFPCPSIDACVLDLNNAEIDALKTAGFEYQLLSGVVKLVGTAPPAPDAVQDEYRYAENLSDVTIPDYDGQQPGYAWTWVNISGAPADAYVTSVQYTVRVAHTYPGDLILAISNEQATQDAIWYRLGGTDDGGFDDDSESDEDIWLYQRTSYSAFDYDAVNGYWYLQAWDNATVDTGFIDYFQLWVYYVVPPPNDDFDNAYVINSLPYSNTQSTANATAADDDPTTNCSFDLNRSVWYRYTAPSDGFVRFETAGSSYDTWLAIYTGTRGNLTEVGCNDDYPDIGLDSRVDLEVWAGTTYYLWIGGDDNDFGTLVLSATELDVGPVVYDGHTIDDDNSGSSSGNDNGQVDCGEHIELAVWLQNQGAAPAELVYASISTSDPYVTRIVDAEPTDPTIPAGGRVLFTGLYFEVAPNTPDGHQILFTLDISDDNGNFWSDSFTVPVACAATCNTPGTPSLVAPGSGATTNDSTPTFDWNASNESDEYQLQVDNSSSFSSPNIDTTTGSTAYTPGSSLGDGIYYWRVRGHNTSGSCDVYGSWSSTRSFTIDTTGPASPNLVSPGNGAVVSDSTPTFDWEPVSGAAEYQLQVDNSSSFSSPNIDTTTGSTAYTPGSSLGDGTYYWRVRARDAVGNWGSWSATWSVVIQTTPDVGPVVYDSHTIDDDNDGVSSGNGNGVLDCGETVEMVIGLRNAGTAYAYLVDASIWGTNDPFVTIIAGESLNPRSIPGGSTAELAPYLFSLASNTPNGHIITFDLYITDDDGHSWVDAFTAPVACAGQPTVRFAAANVTANEGDGSKSIQVTLSEAADQTVTVDYATSNGTATAGADYTAVSGTLSFYPGQTSKTFTVALINDAIDESNETVNLTLSSPNNAGLGSHLALF